MNEEQMAAAHSKLAMARNIAKSTKDLARKASECAVELGQPINHLSYSKLVGWLSKPPKRRKGIRLVPGAEWVIPICMAVDWMVSPNDLRPDLYPSYCVFTRPESSDPKTEGEAENG